MKKIVLFFVAMVVSLATFAQITATWDIEEGATLESFTEATITFTGVESATTTSMYPACFYKVAEDGTATLVENNCTAGTLDRTATGASIKLWVDEETGCYQGKLTSGNYRIILSAGMVKFNNNKDNKNTEDYVLNFTLTVAEQPTLPEPEYTVAPASESTITEFAELTITYDCEQVRVSYPMDQPNQLTWPFLNRTSVNEDGEVTASEAVCPLMWDQIDANVVKISINPMVANGITSWTTPGTYSVTIPAGLIQFSATQSNQPFTLYYTIAEGEEPGEEEIVVTTMEELKANAGKRVLYKGLEPAIVTIDGPWGPESMYFMPDGETNLSLDLYVVPAKFDAYGTLTENAFEIDEVAAISAFSSLSDASTYFTYHATAEEKVLPYEFREEVVVTYVNAMGTAFMVQYEGMDQRGMGTTTYGLQVARPFNPMAEAILPGSGIVMTGVYTPTTTDYDTDTYAPASFELVSYEVKSTGNTIKSKKIGAMDPMELTYYTAMPAYSVLEHANVWALPTSGTIVYDEETEEYYYEFLSMDMETYEDVTARLPLWVANIEGLDFAQYANQPLTVSPIGVFDATTVSFGVLEFKDTNVYFENLQALVDFSNEDPMGAYQTACTLRNPLTVTFVDPLGYIVVEDESGVAYIYADDVAGLASGDVISNVVAHPQYDSYLRLWEVDLTTVVVAEEKAEITPIDVTLAQLNADREATMSGEASQYAFRVVRLTDMTVEATDDDATSYLHQGEDQMEINPKTWKRLGVEEMPEAVESFVGIVDIYGAMYYGLTVAPLNAESVVAKGVDVNVEYAEIGNIYTENGLIVAEGEFQIFTVTGQNVTDMNGNLANGVYVVRTANATAKVVIK